MRVDPLYHLNTASQLGQLSGQETTLTSQLASGLRVAKASDDPTAASTSIRLGSTIARDDAYVQASTGIQSKLQVADSALSSVVTQITSAVALAVQGTNGTLNSANLQAISQQLAGIRDEVVSLANTSYAGNYLFSGTSNTQPYSTETSTSPAVSTYAGDANQQYTMAPGGQTMVTSLAGSAVFSASGADVLGSLNRLIADFASGTASSTSVDDLNELRSSLDNVTSQRSVLDASLNSLSLTTTYTSTEQTNLQASQSTLVAADSAQVATSLSNVETQRQALLSAATIVGKTSLFDYMQ
ncbi:MAG: flagellar hook-associated protein 3 [Acidobacteriaceae bacterium]|nr:flagellar hook-associated protein 3 [Acidobacteriaceae bacterium]